MPDLLFGCGLGYVLLVLALSTARPDMARIGPWLPLVVLVTGIPHYGATLLRVYGTAEARRRYATAAFGQSAVVWVAFVLAAYTPPLGALLITLYLSWSPWHYAGQNYGLAMMFLGRGGVAVSPGARRLLRTSFVLSFALILLNLHRAGTFGAVDPAFAASEQYRFVPLGIPDAVARVIFPMIAAAYLACSIGVLIVLRRVRPQALVACLALVVTQAIWFSLPAVLAHGAPHILTAAGAPAAFIWIALGHSVQYLWVSLAFARRAGAAGGGTRGGTTYLGQTLLAGAAIWVLPALAFSPGALGRVAFDAGLGLLVAAAVNLHHFILDRHIWRLRDPRVRQALVAPASGAGLTARPARPRPLGWALAAVGALCATVWVVTTWEQEIGHRRAAAAGDLGRVRRAAGRLSQLGRDSARLRATLGRLAARQGDTDAALAEYQRSLALAPTASAWAGIGQIRLAQGDLLQAQTAFRKAVALAPERETLHLRLAEVTAALDASVPPP